ncbi:unnamed protein product [Urochloa humidicola]
MVQPPTTCGRRDNDVPWMARPRIWARGARPPPFIRHGFRAPVPARLWRLERILSASITTRNAPNPPVMCPRSNLDFVPLLSASLDPLGFSWLFPSRLADTNSLRYQA